MVEKNKPNIVLIVLDAARPDHFSYSGYQRKTTPNIDRFAKEGIIFENAISAAPWTLPSTASLFTGTYAHKHHCLDIFEKMNENLLTMPEVLSRTGYKTAAIHAGEFFDAKWGTVKGFEHIRTRIPPRRETSDAWWKKILRPVKKLALDIKAFFFLIRDNGASWVNQNLKDWLSAQSKPFFLYLHYMETHHRYLAPPAYRFKFMKHPAAYWRAWSNYRAQASLRQMMRRRPTSRGDIKLFNDLYDGALNYLDQMVGEAIDCFKTAGLFDDTIFIITADHGENLGDHGLFGHHWCVYDSLIKIPLIIHYSKAQQAGVRIKELVQNVDLLPSLLNLIGVDNPEIDRQIEGQSFIKHGRITPSRKFAFSEWTGCAVPSLRKRFPSFDFDPYDKMIRTVRGERYKYIRSTQDEEELYDILSDPGETRNLINECPEVALRLRQTLAEFISAASKEDHISDKLELEQAVQERLKSLGYLD